jgi:zinc protease
MNRRIFVSFVLLCSLYFQLGLLSADAQVRKPPTRAAAPKTFDQARYSIQYQKYVLDNGLTLLVHTDTSVPIVAVNSWYHVGSRNEKRGKTGFAHLFEHFFFNGSENYPHGFREAMDDLGANNRNGTTNSDRTNFFEDVPVSALERTLYLEADRMGFLANYISKEMLERERGVVQNEKRQGENQPYGRVFGEVLGKVYPYSHPYSWSTIGSMEDLNAASLEDVKEWYRTYYGPNNAVIALAGDITGERALELVTKYFGGIPPGPPLPRTEKWIPTFDRNIRDQMEDRVPQARIYRFYHGPAWSDAEGPYLGLFADVLAGGKNSRLERRLVDEKELATGVGAGAGGRELSGLFSITVTVKPGVDPAVVEREMDAVVNDLLEKGPTDEEIERIQNRNLAGFLRNTETLGGFGGRSDVLAESMTYGGSPDAYLGQLRTMATAKPADVKAAANKWLRANHYTMLVKPFPQLTPGKTAVNRKILPELGPAPDIKFPQIQRTKLKNGLNVILLERHTTPIVNATLAVDAGAASDSVAKAGLAGLTLDLMDEGTKTRDALRMERELDSLGARLFTGNGLDMSFVRLQSTTANMRPSLAIMADAALNPSFPADRFSTQKKRRIAQIEQEKANPTAVAQRVLPALIYGKDHAYGKPGSGFTTSLESVTREDLIKWHADWFKPGSATIIIAGDTTMDKLIPALEQTFGPWAGGTAPAKNLSTVAKTPGRKIYLIDKPDATQSVIVAAHISEKSGQPEDLAAEPVFTNFGGIATSRLNRNLRLDKHWSYGTSGFLSNSRGQRTFTVIAPVQTDKTKESMAEVLREIKDIAGDRPIKGEEFASIMRNMTSRLPGRFETLSSLENAAITLVNLGLPDDYWSNYAGRMRGLTESQLDTSAGKFVHPGEIIWLVVGDLSKVEKGIRELGYGDVIRLNADGTPVN